jgi:hypothetical protein
MKVMVDAGYPLHSRFAKTVCGGGLFRSLFKGRRPKDAYPVDNTDKERISMDGDRERHGFFCSRLF